MDNSFVTTAALIAREAGAILRSGYGHVANISYKGVIDPVTEYDHRAENYIISALRQAFPHHRIHAEESGLQISDGEYCWLVDPLDGTVNFAHGVPIFAVSLAIVRQDTLLAGVIYDPLRDELYAAAAGCGATLNGQPIHVSAQTDLNRALLVTGFPYDIRTNPHNNLDHYRNFSLRAQAVRRLGSAALDCAWVAAGRFDGYWELWVKPWDIAAGALLIQEAGGRVTTAAGTTPFLERDSILASNGHLHAAMLTVLQHGAAAPLP